ncbi:protein of unknown function [Pararobbsia alpina]
MRHPPRVTGRCGAGLAADDGDLLQDGTQGGWHLWPTAKVALLRQAHCAPLRCRNLTGPT